MLAIFLDNNYYLNVETQHQINLLIFTSFIFVVCVGECFIILLCQKKCLENATNELETLMRCLQRMEKRMEDPTFQPTFSQTLSGMSATD